MPKSRKRKIARKKRKTVGARSAVSGQFVPKEELATNPAETVAVTREVEPERKPDKEVTGDKN